MFDLHPSQFSTSEYVAESAKEPEPHSKLRSIYSDAAAITQFVDIVRHIHHIKPGLYPLLAVNFEAMLDTQADRIVRRNCPAIRDRGAIGCRCIGSQSAAVQRVRIDPGATGLVLPKVGGAEGTGYLLVVVKINPMVVDVIQIVLAEQELAGNNILTAGFRYRYIRVGRKPSERIIGGELDAIDLALAIVELRQDERLSEQSIIQLVLGFLVVPIHSYLQSGKKFVSDPNIEVIRPFGPGRVAGFDLRFVGRAIELYDTLVVKVLQRGRRKVAGIAGVQGSRFE